MLVTLVPLFDKEMKVSAYSLFAQKENYFQKPELIGIERHVRAVKISGAEVLNAIGVDTLSPGTDIFLPISKIALFTDIPSLCKVPAKRLILTFDEVLIPDAAYINRLMELKEMGYRLALRNLPVSSYVENGEIIKLMDYIMLDSSEIDVTKAKIFFANTYPELKLCVCNIKQQSFFDVIKDDKDFLLFEGEFYRIPVTVGDNEIAPLKATYLQLLNVVNDYDFELQHAADIISRDTALTLSFLKMVNTISGSEINSIRHAAAIMGQTEMKKWINAVVTKELCADRPSEIMRISLLRAKFAENLANTFEMGVHKQELFLMGLFSVLDLILNCSMEEALKKIKVSKNISDALINGKGEFAEVLDFIVKYESANWQEISRQLILKNMNIDDIYDAYISSVCWYRDLMHA